MLNKKPRRGDRIIYNNPNNSEPEQVYVVMGKFHNHEDILNIATPESFAIDGGHDNHTQVIWRHPEGPNPWLRFEEQTATHPITGDVFTLF